MPVIRINADGDRPRMHSGTAPVAQPLHRDPGDGPVIVMIHGWKYKPHLPAHCPHQHLFAFSPKDMPWRAPSWPRQMGFGTGHADEGLAIAFGWNARGAPWAAQASAVAAGRALAEVLNLLHRLWPQRPVHIMGHSKALEALHHLPRGAVDRIISMTGASYRSRVEAALNTAAGRASEFYSITSRENDIVDFLFERLTPPPRSGDHSIGFGLEAPNAVTLQLDCPDTLDHLQAMGAAIGASEGLPLVGLYPPRRPAVLQRAAAPARALAAGAHPHRPAGDHGAALVAADGATGAAPTLAPATKSLMILPDTREDRHCEHRAVLLAHAEWLEDLHRAGGDGARL